MSRRTTTLPLRLGGFLLLMAACGQPSGVRIDPADVLYDGAPYGDFITLGDEVRRCMQSQNPDLPNLTLVRNNFQCYTSLGWKEVYGCTTDSEVYVVAPIVMATHGALWAHELTHYFGTQAEDNSCGLLQLDGFTLAMPDAGH